MTPRPELEIKGSFADHPFPELIVEIAQAGLNGSLRVEKGDTKCVVYFREGKVVFAVSNVRVTRLFDILLRQGKIKKEDLVQIPNFANDMEFAKALVEANILTKADVDRLFHEQISGIALDLMTWNQGTWSFSTLARLREGLSFELDLRNHMVSYSRCLSNEIVLKRFRTMDEAFRRSSLSEMDRDLTLEEGFILSRVDLTPVTAADVISLSSMPEAVVFHALYTLWLGGLLIRENWNSAFSTAFVKVLASAKFDIKTDARTVQKPQAQPAVTENVVSPPRSEAVTVSSANESISLKDYLERVENAATHYDILGIDSKAESSELKAAYFQLAKNFHPDRFHSEGGSQLKRIQSAFTELAQAYETLKTTETREIYDYRVRKELIDREKRREAGISDSAGIQAEQAAENFDRGFSLLVDGDDPEAAVPFFARAAHFAPKNARYRAYYGKALAYDDKHRHKAESEMQAALKLDPDNPNYRIMLAEFFIQFNLLKRAEGELNRLLAIFPSNREARELLDTIKANG